MTTPTIAAVTTQVAALKAAVVAISPLDGQSLAALAPVILAAQAADEAVSAAIAATDLTISTGDYLGVYSGGHAPALAAQLLAQLTILQNMVALGVMNGAVGRISFNLSQATG